MDHDFGHDVLSNILNQHNNDELQVIADQCRREIASGTSVDEAITQAQYALGLSFADTKRVEAMLADLRKKAADSTAPMGASEPEPDPYDAIISALGIKGLNADSPVDLGIINFLQDAKDAGVEALDALHFLAERAQELVAEQSEQGEPIGAMSSLSTQAGLKSTLRKLRQQLNKHDNEDIEGMSKLISCIEGIEKQLERKQKAKDERQSKKKPAEAASDDEKEAEAALPKGQPVPKGMPGDLPYDPTAPEVLPAPAPPIPSGAEMGEHAIELVQKMAQFKKEIASVEDSIRAKLKLPEAEQAFEREKPLFMEYLRTLESQRMLMDKAGQKWSMLLVEQKEAALDKASILEALESRIEEASSRGIKYAKELQKSLEAMKSSPRYQKDLPKPRVEVRPTPKDLQKDPHAPAPSEKRSSLSVSAGMLSSLLDGLSEAVQEIMDALDIADHKLQPAF